MEEAITVARRSANSARAIESKLVERLINLKFIEHNQPDEFIEVFKLQQKQNSGNIDDTLEEFGKTYLHLAVEH